MPHIIHLIEYCYNLFVLMTITHHCLTVLVHSLSFLCLGCFWVFVHVNYAEMCIHIVF